METTGQPHEHNMFVPGQKRPAALYLEVIMCLKQ